MAQGYGGRLHNGSFPPNTPICPPGWVGAVCCGCERRCLCAGPRREQIIRLQGQVDKHYAGLKEAGEQRRRRLEHMAHLFQLKREVEDLEQWIAERDVVASSQEMGQDLDHVTVRMLGWVWRC